MLQYQYFKKPENAAETNPLISCAENQTHLTTRHNDKCDTETPSAQSEELTNHSIIMPTRFGFMIATIKSHLNL
jgi:hypothetical protein